MSATEEYGYKFAFGLAIVVFAAIASVWTQYHTDKTNLEYEKRRSAHITNFNDHLDGIIKPLLALASSDRSQQAAETFVDAVLGAGANLFPEQGLRLCLYALETPEGEGGERARYLQLLDHRGRQDQPRPTFEPGTPHGDHAIKNAQQNASAPFCFVENDPRFDRRPGAVWACYMQFPLYGPRRQRNLGSLMVDSRDFVAWNQEHQAIGQTIATLLAHGLDLLADAANDVEPELASLESVEELQGVLESRLVSGKEVDHG
ncbi:hypothetical protein [Boudabousia liubingyangii]|uniref:hypothetical protein n=1 Tax=Boudabousia liubingyangii TaxID=1921764 RepID=UPI00093AC34E|nr:hypothetical protein [Boudabousia liubingyangii]